jgi:hypothetical protein
VRIALVGCLAAFALGCGDDAPSEVKLLMPGDDIGALTATSAQGVATGLEFPVMDVTIVHVGAFGCALCRQQVDHMVQFALSQPGSPYRFIVVTIDLEDRDSSIRSWADSLPDRFEVWRDPERLIADRIGLDGIPRLVVLNQQGIVAHRERGVPTGIEPRWAAAARTALP